MGFTIWNILKASLLVANAMAILNHKRVIQKCTFLMFEISEKKKNTFRVVSTDFSRPQQQAPQMDQFGSYVTPAPRPAGMKQIGDLFLAASYLRGSFFFFFLLFLLFLLARLISITKKNSAPSHLQQRCDCGRSSIRLT